MSSIPIGRMSLALFMLALASGLAAPAPVKPLKAGDAFPEWKAEALEGTVPDLKGKIVVVDFWASWCKPCKRSFPELEKIHNEYKDKGVVLLGVNVDEKAEDMKKFLAEQKVTFAIVRDKNQKYVAEAGIDAMPTSFVVDATGKIKAVHLGFKGAETVTELRKELDELLKGKTP